MNQIKSLKLKIKRSSMFLDQKRILYCQSKSVMHHDHNKFITSLLCLGAFGFTFILALGSKFSNPIFNIGKNIAKIGLKKILAVRF